jgi:glucokinase
MDDTYASVDLGGTKIAAALGVATGRILCERTIATESHLGPPGVLARVATLLDDLTREAGHRPAALGIGMPGLVDRQRGTTRFLPNLPGNWPDVPVRDSLAPRVGCPVHLLNDVRLCTLGELTFGLGRAAHTMAFFALGTGVGGGLAIDGRLRLGPLGAAGELGHQTILPDGPRCGCGNRGCLEALASGPAIAAQGVWLIASGRAPRLRDLVQGDVSRVTPREMVTAAQAGDEAVLEVLVRCAEYIGIAVANVVTIIHPDLVVLGGGVADIGPLLLDTVREVVHQRVGMFPTDDVRVERSQLGDKAGLLGGLALAALGGDV